ncbi:hypothetical protein C8J56DRAFT_1065194 [Mycena floridula]|nr:hypothetical protein C8J56DRAFT_1065194 [Mycena floridula]
MTKINDAIAEFKQGFNEMISEEFSLASIHKVKYQKWAKTVRDTFIQRRLVTTLHSFIQGQHGESDVGPFDWAKDPLQRDHCIAAMCYYLLDTDWPSDCFGE